MTTYHVYANAAEGYYEADDEQGARDAFAMDAGYQSEADMVEQLEQPSEIVVGAAEPAKAAEIARAICAGYQPADLGFAVEDTGGMTTAGSAVILSCRRAPAGCGGPSWPRRSR